MFGYFTAFNKSNFSTEYGGKAGESYQTTGVS